MFLAFRLGPLTPLLEGHYSSYSWNLSWQMLLEDMWVWAGMMVGLHTSFSSTHGIQRFPRGMWFPSSAWLREQESLIKYAYYNQNSHNNELTSMIYQKSKLQDIFVLWLWRKMLISFLIPILNSPHVGRNPRCQISWHWESPGS